MKQDLKEHRRKQMSNFAKALAAIASVLIIVYFALITMPAETDDCTPNLIDRYNIVIISYRECIALGAQCVITPRDIEKVRINQLQLQGCIMQFIKKTAADD